MNEAAWNMVGSLVFGVLCGVCVGALLTLPKQSTPPRFPVDAEGTLDVVSNRSDK